MWHSVRPNLYFRELHFWVFGWELNDLVGSRLDHMFENVVSAMRSHVTMLREQLSVRAERQTSKREIWNFISRSRDLFKTTYSPKISCPRVLSERKLISKSPRIFKLWKMIHLKSTLANFIKPQSSVPSLYNIVGRQFILRRGPGERKMKSPPQTSQSRMAWPTVTYFTIIAVFSSMVAFNTLHGPHPPPKTKWQNRGQMIIGGADL